MDQNTAYDGYNKLVFCKGKFSYNLPTNRSYFCFKYAQK